MGVLAYEAIPRWDLSVHRVVMGAFGYMPMVMPVEDFGKFSRIVLVCLQLGRDMFVWAYLQVLGRLFGPLKLIKRCAPLAL